MQILLAKWIFECWQSLTVRWSVTIRQMWTNQRASQFIVMIVLISGLLSITGASSAATGALQPQNTEKPLSVVASSQVFLPLVTKPGFATGGLGWAMVAANPQRTSWIPEEVRGPFGVDWYHPIEPYIPNNVQPIAANGAIYVSTARGLYTFRASDGTLLWVYPTELPLGNSPTIAIVNGANIAYVGGYDH